MRAELPASINWLYSFGFKVGIFITLKSFLMLVNQYRSLSIWGFAMIIAQFVMGFIWLTNGSIMQDPSMYEDSDRLRDALAKYRLAALIGAAVVALKIFVSAPYYRNPASVNWFADIFSGAFKEIKNLGTSILFSDNTLWGLFAVLIYYIGKRYHDYRFGAKSFQLRGMLKRRSKSGQAPSDEEASA